MRTELLRFHCNPNVMYYHYGYLDQHTLGYTDTERVTPLFLVYRYNSPASTWRTGQVTL